MNVVALQWLIIRCCRSIGFGQCLESIGGIIQVSLQWLLFTTTFALYLIYYPEHLKYVDIISHPNSYTDTTITAKHEKSAGWRSSVALGWATALHLAFTVFTTLFLIGTSSLAVYPPDAVKLWAGFLGLTSAALAVIQYAPQIYTTWKLKLVGALSIPMMCIQTPGAILMVTNLAIRPGTNWTSWAPYAAAGIMQGGLLALCFVWKARQRRLGVDDFGKPLSGREPTPAPAPQTQPQPATTANTETDVESQLHRQPTLGPAVEHGRGEDERTPLLSGPQDGASSKGGMDRLPWFGKK